MTAIFYEERKNSMRRKDLFYKAMAAALGMSMAAGSIYPMAAETLPEKDENIYVSLQDDGTVAGIYVVNEYTLAEDTQIVDYGDYASVENLTSDTEITLEAGKVTVDAGKGSFYYKGILADAELPWDISIQYLLDGKEITAEELAGKSGSLQIILDLKENKKAAEGFFDNYLVQATVTLDTDLCKQIKTEGATEANIGKDRQILYNIMAGQEKTYTISAEVTDFEMDAITFQAVPMSFDLQSDSFDKDALYEKTDEIKDAAVKFDDGANELKDGVDELEDGAVQLADGSSDLKSGAAQLKDGSGKLRSGASELAEGAGTLSDKMGDLTTGSSDLKKGIEKLSDGIGTMGSGAEELKAGLSALTELTPELVSGSADVLSALQLIQSSLKSINVGTDQMELLLSSSSKILEGIQNAEAGAAKLNTALGNAAKNCEGIEALADGDSSAAAKLQVLAAAVSGLYNSDKDLKKSIDSYAAQLGLGSGSDAISYVSQIAALLSQSGAGLNTLNDGIKVAADGAAELSAGLTGLEENYEKFDESIQGLPTLLNEMITSKLSDLKDGIDVLTGKYETLDDGIGAYTDGVTKIRDGYSELYDGVLASAEGTQEILDGSRKLSQGAAKAEQGASSLVSGSSKVASGAVSLDDGTGELYNGTSELYNGMTELQDGITKLQDGTTELQDGTTEFSDKTSDIDKQVDDEIDKILSEIDGSEFEQISFVSPENTNVGLVQFAIQTNPIAVEEETAAETEAETESFGQKVKGLFKHN